MANWPQVPMPAGPSVLALVGDMEGSAYYRVLSPFRYLEAQGYPAWWAPQHDDYVPVVLRGRNPQGRPCDALIYPRLYWTSADQAIQGIRHWQNDGFAVIGEWDDDVFSPGCVAQAHWLEPHYTRDQIEARRQQRIASLPYLDGVTVSTRRVATAIRQHVADDLPVLVVPNAMDWDWFRRVVAGAPRLVPGLTIGWAGGKRLDHDLIPMAAAWRAVARRHPDVTFIVAGYQPPILHEAVPADRLHGVAWADLESFPRSYVGMDIACCPLAPTLFNTAKSPIKAYEAAGVGAAVVASPTVYGPVLRHGRTGLLADTAEAWTAALTTLVIDAPLRRRLARNWQRQVRRRHTLEQTAHLWPRAWETAVAHYQARRRFLVSV